MTQPLSVQDADILLSDGAQGLHFKNPDTLKILRGEEKSSSTKNETSVPTKQGTWMIDIAQSHHYTIEIEGFSASGFKTPEGNFSKFLPTKSINFNYVSYENMSIPVSIFGDFPLLNKKRVTTVALTCFDLDNNLLERELKIWENSCFPQGRYAAYMEDVARKLIYRGYDVKGKETLKHDFFVIPTGNVSVSRDYSSNDAKLVTFSLVCVGDGSTCATGINRSYKLPVMAGKDFRLSGDDQIREYKTNDLLKYEFIPGDYNGTA